MKTFILNDMTCGHCESVVTRTIKSIDPDAIVQINLNKHQVNVDSVAQADDISDALKLAGYPASVNAPETR